MKKITITLILIGLTLGASVASYAAPMICDMSKCERVLGRYICDKDACRPA